MAVMEPTMNIVTRVQRIQCLDVFWWFVSSHHSSAFQPISFWPSDSQMAAAVTINEQGHIVSGNMTEF